MGAIDQSLLSFVLPSFSIQQMFSMTVKYFLLLQLLDSSLGSTDDFENAAGHEAGEARGMYMMYPLTLPPYVSSPSAGDCGQMFFCNLPNRPGGVCDDV